MKQITNFFKTYKNIFKNTLKMFLVKNTSSVHFDKILIK